MLHGLFPSFIRTANQMVTLYHVELFTLHGVRFRFQSQLQEWYQNWDQNQRRVWECR